MCKSGSLEVWKSGSLEVWKPEFWKCGSVEEVCRCEKKKRMKVKLTGT